MQQHDVIIVGGAFAGMAAATYLGRARRDVCVIDSRQPRNRFPTLRMASLGMTGAIPGRSCRLAVSSWKPIRA